MDMSASIIPKSDQMNADDLIAGPRTITITKVAGNNSEQPVSVHFEGDNGKPWKPGKSMRRMLVFAWGVNAAEYVGRRLTLYCDPDVKFGGIAVGGIRISHMSHIERDMTAMLSYAKSKRAPHTVRVLREEAPKVSNRERMHTAARAAAAKGRAALDAFKAGLQPATLAEFAKIEGELQQIAGAVSGGPKIPEHDPETGEVQGNGVDQDDGRI